MRAWADHSLYVGDSPLIGTFNASRGFAITFTRDGMPALAERFAELWPYFELTVERTLALTTLSERLRIRYRRRCARGYYFNLLSVPAGAGVGRHVDATLDWVTGVKGTTPLLVSVLYLNAPPGGSLNLWQGDAKVASITPEAGSLVCFRGDLGHGVDAVDARAAEPRVSLVCEHYAFTDSQIAQMAPMKVRSLGLFERVLQKKRG
ncbi:MAG: 2OG-Fe(II) oxygenase [Clostridia bacterium]|nr:2OG-Fe(II) oxygenase [Deltaproteobacteria bacterium]